MPQRLHSQIDTHNAHQAHFHSEKLSEHTTLLEAIKTNTSETTINAGDIELHVDGLEGLVTTTNTKLNGGLPSALTGSGNLKVCIQELGNEGSERLNVDVGDDLNQLPTALTGEGNLKVSIQEDHTHNLATSANQTTANGHLATVAGAVSGTEMQVDVLTMPTVAVTLAGGATSALQTTLLNGQTQDGAGGGNKLGVMVDAINTNTITGNGKIDTTNSRLGTINTSLSDIDTTLGTINNQFRGQSQDGNGGGNKLGVMIDAINTNTITQNGKIDSSNTLLTNAEAHLGNIDTGIDVLEACVGSNKVNVNIASNAVDFATQTTLAQAEAHLGNIDTGVDVLEACVGSNKVNVNIASNAVDFATQTTLAAAEAHLGNIETSVQLIDDVVGTDGSTGPAKCISIGGTNLLGGAIQEISCDGDGHLQVDILSSALPSGAAQELSNSVIATKSTLATSSEVKELLSGVTVNASALSSEFDTENYERIRFFGETTALLGLANIAVFGSNTSGGTFYNLGEVLTGITTGSTHYVFGKFENLPRYIKIFNTHGSTNFTFTKLYLQGSGGRLGV